MFEQFGEVSVSETVSLAPEGEICFVFICDADVYGEFCVGGESVLVFEAFDTEVEEDNEFFSVRWGCYSAEVDSPVCVALIVADGDCNVACGFIFVARIEGDDGFFPIGDADGSDDFGRCWFGYLFGWLFDGDSDFCRSALSSALCSECYGVGSGGFPCFTDGFAGPFGVVAEVPCIGCSVERLDAVEDSRCAGCDVCRGCYADVFEGWCFEGVEVAVFCSDVEGAVFNGGRSFNDIPPPR
ncbi:MAG: hypothetical protein ALMCE001_03710 [Methanocorpusculum sp. MCE]|nr:MAG: hypothetical protein ALMCE001_03710 [Methanocorpusculum sp. MCE]